MGNQVEGYWEEGQKVVVIEDLISTGGSSLKAVEALRKAGLEVRGLLAIFTYGFALAEKNFQDAKCPYTTLTNYDLLLNHARGANLISSEDEVSLNEWRQDPKVWPK